MLDMLNGGALMVMTSVGHRTGLFDALAELDGATSHELADAAGLDERYVSEWLGAMATGRIVELDPETGRYSLPAEHAAWLTRAASPDNLAVEAQWITDALDRRGRHRRVLRERRRRAVRALRALPRGDGRGERADGPLGAVLAHPSARPRDGRAPRGRRVAARPRLRARPGASAARRALPGERSWATTCRRRRSRTRPRRRRSAASTNVRFEQRDLSTFDGDAEPEAFDYVTTFDAVHDQARPLALLKASADARARTASS